MKDNNHFDRIISEKLEALRPEYRPESWEQFEQRLDAGNVGVPEPEARAVDETVYNKIHRLEVPYQQAHWSKMAKRLDQEFVRPEQVLSFKVTELALFALLIFSLWHQLPEKERLDPTPQTQAALSSSDREGRSASLAAAAPPENPAPETQRTASESSTASETHTSGRTQAAPPPQKVEISGQFPAPDSRRDPALTSNEPDLPQRLKHLQTPAFLPEELLLADPFKNASPPSTLQSKAPAKEQSLTTLPALEPAMVKPAGYAQLQTAGLPPGRPAANLYFGMFGSLDYNRIITPADRFLDVETKELDRFELGYSGGFSFAAEIGKAWEIQTGLIYSAKKYQPSALIVQSGNFRDGYEIEQLKDIELNIIQIPLNFRYNLFHYDKWRFYLLGGASLQVATLGNYYVESEGTRRSSLLSEYIENGWFEGGDFRDNSYLTGNLGFGLEHFVSTQWSLFAQPTYQQAINFFDQGLGSTHDRISTMSIFSGIRIRLRQ